MEPKTKRGQKALALSGVIEMKHYYPVIFFPDETGTGRKTFGAQVPDIEGCLTQGEDLTDAMNWIVDAIGTMLDGVDEKDYPKPSKPADLDLSEYPPDSIVNIIEFDTEKYFHTIKYTAQKKGLNIKQTAELLGAPYRTIQNYWNGERRPPAWLERLIVKEIESLA